MKLWLIVIFCVVVAHMFAVHALMRKSGSQWEATMQSSNSARNNNQRLAVTGCDAEPALGHLHGDCTQKIAPANVHPAMAQDRVGGCEMEIEVRQHEMV